MAVSQVTILSCFALLHLVMLISCDKIIDVAKLLMFSFCCFTLSNELVCLLEKWKRNIPTAVAAWRLMVIDYKDEFVTTFLSPMDFSPVTLANLADIWCFFLYEIQEWTNNCLSRCSVLYWTFRNAGQHVWSFRCLEIVLIFLWTVLAGGFLHASHCITCQG